MNSNYRKWDVLGIIGIFLCSVGLYMLFQYVKYSAAARKITGTAPVLSEKYNNDNRKWFRSKLPSNVKVYYGDADGNTAMVTPEGNTFYIEINPRYNSPNQEMLSLFHEECHIAVWKENGTAHSLPFQECMLDLAQRGAFSDLW